MLSLIRAAAVAAVIGAPAAATPSSLFSESFETGFAAPTAGLSLDVIGQGACDNLFAGAALSGQAVCGTNLDSVQTLSFDFDVADAALFGAVDLSFSLAAYDRGNASFEPNDFIEVALNDTALLTLNGINRRGAGFTDAAGTTALPADGLFRSFQFEVGDLLRPGDNLLSFSFFNTTTNEFVGLDDVALTAQPSFGVQGTDFAVVPVPGSLALMGLGVAAVGARLRRHG